MIYVFLVPLGTRTSSLCALRSSTLAEGARTTKDISVGRTGQRPVFHAHESPRVMTMPLIVLALCSILFVLVLTPAWPWLHAYLNGEPARVDFSLLIQPILSFLACAGRRRNWS